MILHEVHGNSHYSWAAVFFSSCNQCQPDLTAGAVVTLTSLWSYRTAEPTHVASVITWTLRATCRLHETSVAHVTLTETNTWGKFNKILTDRRISLMRHFISSHLLLYTYNRLNTWYIEDNGITFKDFRNFLFCWLTI